jgi:hypothetical protein
MIDVVDIRDYGAIGDGFHRRCRRPGSRRRRRRRAQACWCPKRHRTASGARSAIAAPVRFHGTLSRCPTTPCCCCRRSFDLADLCRGLRRRRALAFRKALQALFNFTDHESLDMGGRRVQVNGPIDVAAAVANKATFETRRVLRNGQLDAQESAAWDPAVVTQQARPTIPRTRSG